MREGYQRKRCLRLVTRFIKEYQTSNIWHQEVIDSLNIRLLNDPFCSFGVLAYTFITGPTKDSKDHKYFYAHIWIDLLALSRFRFESTRVLALKMEAEKTMEELLRVVDKEVATGEVIPTISPVMKQEIIYLGTFRIGGKK